MARLGVQRETDRLQGSPLGSMHRTPHESKCCDFLKSWGFIKIIKCAERCLSLLVDHLWFQRNPDHWLKRTKANEQLKYVCDRECNLLVFILISSPFSWFKVKNSKETHFSKNSNLQPTCNLWSLCSIVHVYRHLCMQKCFFFNKCFYMHSFKKNSST